MNNERIDIELMESRIRLWREGDISDEDLALEMDYMVPELKRCYGFIDELKERPRDDEVENYPEPDELTPSNTTRAGADWPSGPNM